MRPEMGDPIGPENMKPQIVGLPAGLDTTTGKGYEEWLLIRLVVGQYTTVNGLLNFGATIVRIA
jgi:hypothetical protein